MVRADVQDMAARLAAPPTVSAPPSVFLFIYQYFIDSIPVKEVELNVGL